MLSRLNKQLKKGVKVYDVKPVHVDSGLALTPKGMIEMSESGIPISAQTQSADNFTDGDNSPFVNLDPMQARGIDVVDVWDMQMNARKKLMNAHIKDIADYGNETKA